jgi:threonine dehydrogenase-like Zn-dependent dehydrogenase
MHALAWYGKRDIRLIDAPRPLITDPRDIVLKITATTICGSDLHMYSNATPDMHKGDILGHEFMGVVEEVGPEVKNIKTGQRVVVAFGIACGTCEYCKRQEFTGEFNCYSKTGKLCKI